jgi:hypothetical protein
VWNARLEFERSITEKCKAQPKLLYAYINSQKNFKQQIRVLTSKQGEEVSDPVGIANCLNDNFYEIFTKGARGAPLPDFPMRTEKECNPKDDFLSEIYVLEELKKLDRTKSIGTDGLSPHVLRECAACFAYPLSCVFKLSYRTGELPKSWKEANITALYKKGKRSDPSNYRPVSLTSIACKIMEKLVKSVMIEHLAAGNLLSNCQHGFTRNKSCTTNLLETLDALTGALNNGHYAILILLDFAKAFDLVPHEELILKIRAYGFAGELLNWLIDFLSNRKQRVVMGSSSSDWRDVTSGVPQGSVLGPLLFLVFINDMPDLVSHLVKLFADDSKIAGIIKEESDVAALRSDVDRLVEWADEWRMKFNYNKCKVMYITKRVSMNLQLPFRMLDRVQGVEHCMEQVYSERDLGIQLQSDLKWDEQVKIACANANKTLGMLHNTFKCWDERMLRTLYSTYVRPHLEYAVSVWAPYNEHHIKQIERIQERATKMVYRLRRLKYEARLDELGLTKLSDRRKRGDAILMYKINKGRNIVNWSYPMKIYEQPESGGPACGLRAPRRFVKPEFLIRQREHFFTTRIVNEWNAFPQSLCDARSTNSFKSQYDKNMERKN